MNTKTAKEFEKTIALSQPIMLPKGAVVSLLSPSGERGFRIHRLDIEDRHMDLEAIAMGAPLAGIAAAGLSEADYE